MRVLIAPLNARLGGTQINCVDLGASVRDLGHEVLVYVEDGPLSELIVQRGLPHVVAERAAAIERGTGAARAFRDVVSHEGADLVHAYERARAIQAYFGAYVLGGVPVVATIYSMSVSGDLPGDLPIVVGTRDLMTSARKRRSGSVDLLEPPVDTVRDNPGEDGSAFRTRMSIGTDELAVVVVSRLSQVLKLGGVLAAIDAVSLLSVELPIRLLIVGDGPARPRVEEQANVVNGHAGRPIVTLTGSMADPRPAYAAADVVLGMGSSALRAMAFEKPTIVLGEGGFSQVFEPASAPTFLEIGMYGFGNDAAYLRLGDQLRRLLTNERLRKDLGRFSRSLVEERFSLTAGAKTLEAIYRREAQPRPGRSGRLARGVRAGAGMALAWGRRSTRPAQGRAGRRPSEW